jgi:hypothetical protein
VGGGGGLLEGGEEGETHLIRIWNEIVPSLVMVLLGIWVDGSSTETKGKVEKENERQRFIPLMFPYN